MGNSSEKVGAGLLLPGKLGAGTASDLYETLSRRRGKAVVIDAGAVKNLGAQALQVLISAKRQWDRDGHRFEIIQASAEFQDALMHFGMSSLIPHEQETNDEG